MSGETYLVFEDGSEAIPVTDTVSITSNIGIKFDVSHSPYFGGVTKIAERRSRRNMSSGSVRQSSLGAGESFEIPHTNPKVTVVCALKVEKPQV